MDEALAQEVAKVLRERRIATEKQVVAVKLAYDLLKKKEIRAYREHLEAHPGQNYYECLDQQLQERLKRLDEEQALNELKTRENLEIDIAALAPRLRTRPEPFSNVKLSDTMNNDKKELGETPGSRVKSPENNNATINNTDLRNLFKENPEKKPKINIFASKWEALRGVKEEHRIVEKRALYKTPEKPAHPADGPELPKLYVTPRRPFKRKTSTSLQDYDPDYHEPGGESLGQSPRKKLQARSGREKPAGHYSDINYFENIDFEGSGGEL
ncbi:hypothetical protein NKR23_g11506 [Pleurostoma richardsiae]|uniref:Uncharacterized protein n=1 Tax=Pleurostoma richardsiae TaxID=41990 RepID=A0AA38R7P6_9PEZI|nr:hypothetical protein NKR23_g11506 [Pleurostoma richardsiae]